MNAIDTTFRSLRAEGRKALLPFITAGDPDLEFTARVLRELDACGASLCELGIPYSDPIADGPVIQASYQRALDGGVRLPAILEMVRTERAGLSFPLVSMVSYSIILRQGLAQYVDRAIEAGFSGAIVPDLLVEEAGPLAEVCAARDFSLVQLVTPTTPRERQLRIAEASSGFLYCVSVAGITGERQQLPPQLIDNVAWLRERTELPLCIGFGISTAEHVRQLAPVADGVIVGSAFMRRIADAAGGDRDAAIAGVRELADELIAALNESAATTS